MPFSQRKGKEACSPAFLLVLALLLASLVSCSEKTEPTPASHLHPAGGHLRLAQQAPRSLDPLRADSVYESLPINQIFDGLVDLDTSLSIVPCLAHTWTISRDGRTYTFRLRPGVRFHDGTPLTSDDVVFTLERLLAPEHGQQNVACSYLSVVTGASSFGAGRSRHLAGVAALDPLTVRIQLDRPYSSFLEVLAMDGLRIVPRAVGTTVGSERFGRRPVGTGPFRLASWGEGDLQLERNPDYFGQAPRLDRVDIHFLSASESDHGAGRFYRGELDAVDVAPSEFRRLAQDRDVRFYRYPQMSLTFLGFNTNRPPLNDARVRQAIAHALNRSALVSEGGLVYREASGILPPGLAGYVPGIKALAFDPEKARGLLKEAGYPGGRGLAPLKLYAASNSPFAAVAIRQIGEDLASVGIRLEAHPVTWEELTRRLDTQSAPAFLLSWIADLSDPDSFLRSLFESRGPANFFGLLDPVTDRLLESGAQEMDLVRRADTYRRVERHLLEIAPLVPMVHTLGVLALRKQVQGLEPGPLGLANAGLEKVWFSDADGSS